MTVVRWLNDLTSHDLEVAGGKGCNLGEAIRAGLPVPQGFVITTGAYKAFVSENGLDKAIDQALAAARSVDAASDEIRKAFTVGHVPEEVTRSIADAYTALGGGPVAVRSSATAEDLPDASFAGQQETYLYQEGVEAVIASVQKCWSSLWTPRAMAYRERQNIEPGAVGLAVVVQSMVAATSAGVLFTANPLNGRRDQMVIDAAWGLGESVVSGQVNPDHWVVHAGTCDVVHEWLGSKEVMTVRVGGGTATVPVSPALRLKSVLDSSDIRRLVELGRKASAHFGSPQDIEWAIAGGEVFVVQSRPITSLFPLPRPEPGAGEGLRVYVNHTLIQGISGPLTPMGMSLLREAQRANKAINGAQIQAGGEPPIMKEAAGRLFIDVTDTMRHKFLAPKLLMVLGRVEPRTASILRELAGREPALRYRKQPFPKSPVTLSQGFRVFGGMLRAMVSPDRERCLAIERMESAIRAIEDKAQSLKDIRRVREFVVTTIARLRDILMLSLATIKSP